MTKTGPTPCTQNFFRSENNLTFSETLQDALFSINHVYLTTNYRPHYSQISLRNKTFKACKRFLQSIGLLIASRSTVCLINSTGHLYFYRIFGLEFKVRLLYRIVRCTMLHERSQHDLIPRVWLLHFIKRTRVL